MGKKGEVPGDRACLSAIFTRQVNRAELVGYVGGGLVELKVVTTKGKQKVEVSDGAVTRRYYLDEWKADLKRIAPKRGYIGRFSMKSKNRLQKQFGRINYEKAGLPTFITLTYPREWPSSPKIWKTHLNRFIDRFLCGQYPSCWGVWRLEFQKRGAPHFHLLVWDGPQVKGVRFERAGGKWGMAPDVTDKHTLGVLNMVSDSWYCLVGSGDSRHLAAGTRVEPIATIGGVMAYVAKYVAKVEDIECGALPGRFWGAFGRERWPVEQETVQVDVDEYKKLRRVVGRLSNSKFMQRVASGRLPRGVWALGRVGVHLQLKNWIKGERPGEAPF